MARTMAADSGSVAVGPRGVVDEGGLDLEAGEVERALVVQALVRLPLGPGDDLRLRCGGDRLRFHRGGRQRPPAGRGRSPFFLACAGTRVHQVQLQAGGQVTAPPPHAHLGTVRRADPIRARWRRARRGASPSTPALRGFQGDPLGPLPGLRATGAGLDGALDLGLGVRPRHAEEAVELGVLLGQSGFAGRPRNSQCELADPRS